MLYNNTCTIDSIRRLNRKSTKYFRLLSWVSQVVSDLAYSGHWFWLEWNVETYLYLTGFIQTMAASQPIYNAIPDYEKRGLSIEDREFLKLMEEGFIHKNENGNWITLLPFCSRSLLPNRSHTLRWANMLHGSLQRNEMKRLHFFQFMEKILDSGHREIAPSITTDQECFHLPLFGVHVI